MGTSEVAKPLNGDLWLKCLDCEKEFVFPLDEQQVFKNLGFEGQPPKRCVDCRREKKDRNRRIAAKEAGKGKGKDGKAGKSKGKGKAKDGKGFKGKGEGKGKGKDATGKGGGGACFKF